ncbi:MAG TPA: response regulator [Candidatus Sumerlaeota bacterium]|nr:response regulator [Candidatus Sumerlaeota bacterium]
MTAMDEEKVNVLLVDDRPENLRALEVVLEPLNENLVRVNSGEAALRAALRSEFAVILLDVRMPDLDGYETASMIRERPGSAHTPIIFVTAEDADRRRMASGYAAGAVDYIVKPIEPEILRSKVRVFADLYRNAREVERQARELEAQNLQQRELIARNAELQQRLTARAVEADRRAQQLKIMSSELAHAEQRERRRLARILHDHLQQILVASLFRLQSLRRGSCHDLAGGLSDLRELLQDALQASRSLTAELSPPILHEAGLEAALQWLGRRLRKELGLAIELDVRLNQVQLPDELNVLLFQAVRELLFNVHKHSGTNQAFLTACADGDILHVEVADQGRGFDPALLDLDHTTHESFGLFSIRERLEVVGGGFYVHSRPGGGACFRLELPKSKCLQRQPQAAAGAPAAREESLLPEPPVESPARARTRVLVADDHKILREGLANLLREKPGLEVVGEAASGEVAVDLARALRPDVVIMDISMPGINGVEATRRIVNAHSGIRVVGLSMHDSREMTQAMLAAGAEVLLPKDGSVERLVEVIFNDHPNQG